LKDKTKTQQNTCWHRFRYSYIWSCLLLCRV